ncbi:MAG: hypothetical protein ACI92G_001668 [Candidatus Pelagisphaera sp.]
MIEVNPRKINYYVSIYKSIGRWQGDQMVARQKLIDEELFDLLAGFEALVNQSKEPGNR